jgi:hypothetical protein
MEHAAHDLRELLSLAHILRSFAEDHAHDNCHDLFLNTAVMLEQRARFIATAGDADGLEHDISLHAPINMMV